MLFNIAGVRHELPQSVRLQYRSQQHATRQTVSAALDQTYRARTGVHPTAKVLCSIKQQGLGRRFCGE